MKISSVLLSAAFADDFAAVTDHVPNAFLNSPFDCEGEGQRIVGGVFAQKSIPFIVQMRSFNKEEHATSKPWNHDSCGGAIIHDKWILTAAHCCVEKNYHEFWFGSLALESNSFKMGVGRDKLHIHPEYSIQNDGDTGRDYCLVEMPHSISAKVAEHCEGDCAYRMCLPKVNPITDKAGEACWIGGWGVEDYDADEVPESLKSVGVNIFSQATTKEITKQWHWSGINWGNEFAAGLPDNNGDGLSDAGSDSCSGDSGMPLFCEDNGVATVYGLSSWGDESCGKKGLPSVYANVFYAMDWINEKIGGQVTTTKQTTTTKATTTQDPDSDCPNMKWKGKKATKMMYKGRENGKRSYVIRQTILNNDTNHPNIRESEYTGFFMFARRYCGSDFFEGLGNGDITLGIYDYDANYELKYLHSRVDGSKGSGVTFQFHQKQVGEQDAPWSKKNGNSVKKDQFFLTINGVPDSFDASKEADCFNLMAGVLPNGFSHDHDWSECAAGQKDAGW